MFTVTFKRADQKPKEIYCYQNEAGARYHFSLFLDDDSGLYKSILLENESQIIGRITF